MALWHAFKLVEIKIKGQSFKFIKDSSQVAYYPNGEHLLFNVKYFSGEMGSFLGIPVRKKIKIHETIQSGDYQIKILEKGDEQTQQIKNLGGGAIIGAAVAGPIGAAAGAYLGSKLKSCPCIITIPSLDIKVKALAPIGYLKNQAISQFFDEE